MPETAAMKFDPLRLRTREDLPPAPACQSTPPSTYSEVKCVNLQVVASGKPERSWLKKEEREDGVKSGVG